jgi:predicted dehydrogenase
MTDAAGIALSAAAPDAGLARDPVRLNGAPTATERLGVAVVGCGVVGKRRAHAAAAHAQTRMLLAVDTQAAEAASVASTCGGGVSADWREALERSEVSIVVVSTPNAFLVDIGVAALEAGKHVLVEKPPGRNVRDAARLAAAARATGLICKVGFNHRYHPAIRRAHTLLRGGAIGRLINMRARYGHGGRPGCETEWRANPELSGGGELLDQGVHVIDLFRWFAGDPMRVAAMVQTAVWPIEPLEDNAFALLSFGDGVVAQAHLSMTQWKNLFSLEVFGERGALIAEGLGGSYGAERLVHMRRRPEGGAPELDEEVFEGDPSWACEWAELVDAIVDGRPVEGDASEGVAVMRVVDALYRSARAGVAVAL